MPRLAVRAAQLAATALAYALASRAHVLAQDGRREEALADARALVAAPSNAASAASAAR